MTPRIDNAARVIAMCEERAAAAERHAIQFGAASQRNLTAFRQEARLWRKAAQIARGGELPRAAFA